MKKLIATILLLILIFGTATAECTLYPRFGNVVDIEYDSDFVTVDDGLGNLWDFYGVDYFMYGDLVIMIMTDSGTPNWIYDDMVENAYKCSEEDAEKIIQEYKNFFQKLF